MGDTRQIGPRLEDSIANSYERYVRLRNGGVFKGRFGGELERSMQLSMGLWIATHPEPVDELLESAEDDPDVDVAEVERVFDESFELAMGAIEPLVAERAEQNPSGADTEEVLDHMDAYLDHLDGRLERLETIMIQILQNQQNSGSGSGSDESSFRKDGGGSVDESSGSVKLSR